MNKIPLVCFAFHHHHFIRSSLSMMAEANYPSVILKSLHEDEQFKDFKFIVGEKRIRVHKALLGVNSPVFKAMFTLDMAEKKTGELKIDHVGHQTFEVFIKLFYGLNLEGQELITALECYKLAHFYERQDIKSICLSYIKENAKIEHMDGLIEFNAVFMDPELNLVIESLLEKSPITRDNAVSLLEVASKIGFDRMKILVFRFICENDIIVSRITG